MKLKSILLFTCASILAFSGAQELKFLHVISVNKFYTPDYNPLSNEFEMPAEVKYDYYLSNAYDVPNSVKLALFNLGTQLRSKYDSYLGSLYFDDVIKMQTTEFPVSIIAGELINAGLWPPVEPQIWNADLNWQPIPFEYKPAREDAVMLGTRCPNFRYETYNVINNHYTKRPEHQQLINYINENGQLKLEDPVDVALFYLALENSVELNQTRPEWIDNIYPSQNLSNLVMEGYNLLSITTLQKRLNGGALLKSIIQDSKDQVKGKFDLRKINVYSGDDRNFAAVMKHLKIPIYDLPRAGDAIIFELTQEGNDHFVKIFYYSSGEFLPVQMEDCEVNCHFDKFTSLLDDLLPENELSLCGSMVHNANSTENPKTGGTASALLSNSFLIIASLLMTYEKLNLH